MTRKLTPLLTAFIALTFAIVFQLGCMPTQISGARAPTPYTFNLLDSDIAYAEADACAQDWVTGNVEQDHETAHALLKERGVKIRGRNFIATATALARTLWVSKGFNKRSDADQVVLLSHELVHYCQRDEQGGTAFEESYFASPGRWRAETPAYLQSYRTMLMQCVSIPVIEAKITERVKTMRNKYVLWDLDPEQYESETPQIWRSILDTPPPWC